MRIEIYKQFIKFCIIGAVNTIIDYAVYLLLNRVYGVYFLYANIIAITVAMSSSFIFNKYWTFRNNEKKIPIQSAKFVIVNVLYFFLNNSIVFALANYLAVYDILAKIVATIAGLFWNFFANRYWTFKKTL
ncbi:GtrA family protein [Patescibacteria group bacterium]